MKKSMLIHLLFVTIAVCLCTSEQIHSSPLFIAHNLLHKIYSNNTKQDIQNLSMQEAVELAYTHRVSLQALKYAIQARKAEKKRALADYLPSIDVSLDSHLRKGCNLGTSATLQTRQLVYSFAGPLERYDIIKQDERAAYYAQCYHKDCIRNQVELAFLHSWLTQKRCAQEQSRAIKAQIILKSNNHFHDVGLLNKNAWLKQQALYAQNVTIVDQHRDALAIAQAELENCLGMRLDSNLCPKSMHKKIALYNKHRIARTLRLDWDLSKKICIKKLRYYHALALKHHKEIWIKNREIRREQLTELFTIKKDLPEFWVRGIIQRDHFLARKNKFYPNILHQEIGAHVTCNVMNSWRNRGQAEVSRARILKATLEKQDLIERIQRDVHVCYHRLLQAVKQLKAQNIIVQQAHTQKELDTQNYALGFLTIAEISEAEFNWQQAKFEWFCVRVRTQQAICNLLFSCGYPPDESV